MGGCLIFIYVKNKFIKQLKIKKTSNGSLLSKYICLLDFSNSSEKKPTATIHVPLHL